MESSPHRGFGALGHFGDFLSRESLQLIKYEYQTLGLGKLLEGLADESGRALLTELPLADGRGRCFGVEHIQKGDAKASLLTMSPRFTCADAIQPGPEATVATKFREITEGLEKDVLAGVVQRITFDSHREQESSSHQVIPLVQLPPFGIVGQSRVVKSRLVKTRLVKTRLVMSRLVMSRLVMSRLVMSRLSRRFDQISSPRGMSGNGCLVSAHDFIGVALALNLRGRPEQFSKTHGNEPQAWRPKRNNQTLGWTVGGICHLP